MHVTENQGNAPCYPEGKEGSTTNRPSLSPVSQTGYERPKPFVSNPVIDALDKKHHDGVSQPIHRHLSGEGNFMSETFNDPKLAISKVYTKTGDRGKTSLVGGQRVPKDDPRIEAYGTVDELNAFVGSLIQSLEQSDGPAVQIQWFRKVLIRIQHELFNLGAILATLPEDIHPKQAQIRKEDIQALERDIDICNDTLPALRSFVLPGGSRCNTDLHICRTVCRRAERALANLSASGPQPELSLIYLNRLSDAFFVWSRWINKILGHEEILWNPNEAASGNQGQS